MHKLKTENPKAIIRDSASNSVFQKKGKFSVVRDVKHMEPLVKNLGETKVLFFF